MLTVESVARHAGVSRSWIYTQTDLKEQIGRLRAQHRPDSVAPIPARQRASDDSLRRRLEIANLRNRELAEENQRLRHQLARALGQNRDNGRTPPKDQPAHRSSVPIGHADRQPACTPTAS